MKKKRLQGYSTRVGWTKPLRVMKLTAFLILILVFDVSASVFSQNSRISVKVENGTLSEIFSKIEEQSEFRFFYQNEQIKNVQRKSVEVKDESISDLVGGLLDGTGLTFNLVDRNIIVFPKSGHSTLSIGQQKIKLSGKVTDISGQTLPGVTVVVKGTTNGAITNFDGVYTLSDVPSDGIVLFSFVGMKMQEIPVEGKTSINVIMEEDAIGIEEVVAIGYGTVKRKDLTGSVASVKGQELIKVPTLGVNQAIQGRASGVYVSNNQAQPGGNVTVRIRGTNSIQGDNEPLYIIDGFVGGDISTVDPSDIESVDILKDASSTAIYGARGANGVILVTTKSGKIGRNNISFDAYYGLQTVARKLDLMNATEYANYANLRNEVYGNNPIYDPDNLESQTDWQDLIYRIAPMQNYNISSMGGVDKLKYYISGNYIQQDGVVKETGYNRYNLRINLDSKLSDLVSIGTRLSVSRTYRTLNFEETEDASTTHHPVAVAIELAPTLAAVDEEGNLLDEIVTLDNVSHPHPLYHLENVISHDFNTFMNGNLYAELNLLKELKFKSTFSFSINNAKRNRFKPSYVFETNDTFRNRANVWMNTDHRWISENYFNYSKKLGENKLNLTSGFSASRYYRENLNATIYDFAVDDFEYHNLSAGDITTASIGSSMSEWSRLSFLGRAQLNLGKKYLLTLNGRYDGASRFGKNNKWAFFPSGAIAWRISEEPFIKDLNVFDNFKIRASYGISGSEALGPFSSFSQMTSKSNSGYIIGGNPEVGFIPLRLPNPELRWEQTSQLDIGLDLTFNGGRLNIVADYYDKTTKDLFLDKPVPQTNGVSEVRQNIGSLNNRGFEFGFDWLVLNKEFKWNVGFNVTNQKSEILNLGFDDTVEEKQIIIGYIGGNLKLGEVQVMRVGEPLGTFFGYETDGVWQEDELETAWTQFGSTVKAGDVKFVDQGGDGIINSDDRVIIGNAQPTFFGGFNNTFSYKGFDVSLFMQYAFGNNVLNASRYRTTNMGTSSNKLRETMNAWTPENTDTKYPRIGYAYPGVISDLLLEDGSFLRIGELTVGYSLPRSVINKLHLSKLRIYATASNLYTFTKYTGYDPEVNIYGGDIDKLSTDNGSYPKARTVMLGINMSF